MDLQQTKYYPSNAIVQQLHSYTIKTVVGFVNFVLV